MKLPTKTRFDHLASLEGPPLKRGVEPAGAFAVKMSRAVAETRGEVNPIPSGSFACEMAAAMAKARPKETV